jgi:hypothetical protein
MVKNLSGPRPCSSPVKHTSFDTPHKSSFTYLVYTIWRYLSRENRERFSHRLNELYFAKMLMRVCIHRVTVATLDNKHYHCTRMFDQLARHTLGPKTIHTTNEQDLQSSSTTSRLVLTMIVSPYLCDRLSFVKV